MDKVGSPVDRINNECGFFGEVEAWMVGLFAQESAQNVSPNTSKELR